MQREDIQAILASVVVNQRLAITIEADAQEFVSRLRAIRGKAFNLDDEALEGLMDCLSPQRTLEVTVLNPSLFASIIAHYSHKVLAIEFLE